MANQDNEYFVAPNAEIPNLRLPPVIAALRHRNFRLFWFGQLISLIGTWMQSTAMGWMVLRLTDSPFYLGLIGFTGAIPFLLFSLPAGSHADRTNKRKLLIFTQSSSMLLALLLGLLITFKQAHISYIVIISFMLGVINTFDMPARQAFVIEMVGKEDLMNAIALNSSIFNASRMVGPAIAGLMVSKVGEAGCFYLNAISYLAVIAGLILIKIPETFKERHHLWKGIKEGLYYLKHNYLIMTIIMLIGISSLFATAYGVLMPVFARDILKIGAVGFGLMLSAAGIGAFLGAISLASLGNTQQKGNILITGSLLLPVMLVIFALSHWVPLSFIALIGVGWAMVSQNATANTLVQLNIPDALRGRVMSIYAMTMMGLIPFGSLLAGALAQYLSPSWAIIIGALICLFFVIAVYLKLPEIRRM
jgi:MFS family permease